VSVHNPGDPGRAETWGWVGELERRLLAETAKVSLELLLRGSEWVNRRVETIELIDEATVRQSVSVDFRLPKRLPGGFPIENAQHYALPLLVLPRRTDLAYFDVRDESGCSLPILTRDENARLSGRMLIGAAEAAITRDQEGNAEKRGELERSLRIILAGLPSRSPDRAREMVRRLTAPDQALIPDPALAGRLLADENFRDLLGLFQWASAIHVPIRAAPGERRIVKLSWEGRWGASQLATPQSGVEASLRRAWNRTQGAVGWRAENRVLELSQLGGTQSHHIQISTPGGVEMSEVSAPNVPPRVMLPGGPGLPDPKTDPDRPRSETPSRRVHLYLPGAHEMRVGVLDVNLRTPRHGLLMAALLTGFFVTALLSIYAARAQEIIGQSDTGAGILLLVPALLAGFLVRPGEHAMARVLLRGPRVMTTALGILPLIGAASLVTSPNEEKRSGLASFLSAPHSPLPSWLPTLWWALAVAAALITLALCACWLGRGAGSEDD
jgi:hypothetical protein